MNSPIVIAGAGIAGVATAYSLAENHGLTGITLVDPRPPLTLTSNKSGANYRDWWPHPALAALVRRSIVLMQSLHRAGAPFTMNRRGYLYLTRDPLRAAGLPDLARQYRSAGGGPIRTHGTDGAAAEPYQAASADSHSGPDGADVFVTSSPLQRAFNHLAPELCGGIHARNAGSVDPVALGQYLLAEAKRRGVRLERGEIVAVGTRRGRVRDVSVRTEHGALRIATECFVNAAGPFLPRVQHLVGKPVPLRNVLQQKVWIPDPHGVLPAGAPFTTSLDPMEGLPAGLHIKPESVDGIAGIKLGWAFNNTAEDPVWEPTHSPEFPELVLQCASRLIPGLKRYSAGPLSGAVQTSGYYTIAADDLPVIGPAGPDGAFLAGGLAGYGAMAACAVGEIAAAWIANAARPDLAAAFEPARFENAAYRDSGSALPSGTL